MRESDATALARGSLLNLLGLGLPLIVAVLCLPVVVEGLGPERFGVLAFSWAAVGSVGAFDLGLARAASRFVGAALARGAADEVPRILGSALLTQAVLGALATGLMIAAAPVVVRELLLLPEHLQPDAIAALRVVALSAPVLLLSSTLRGALYAAQRFAAVNLVVVGASSSMYLLSALGVVGGLSVPAIVAVLVASKAGALAVLWIVTRRQCPGLPGRHLAADTQALRELARFGSWITVSSVMVPVLSHAEQLLIPALLSIAALTFYTVPSEALSRAAIFPASMALALFPAFSRVQSGNTRVLTDLIARPVKYLLIGMTPPLAFAALFSRELLGAWMGPAFASEAAAPLQILALAFYFSGFSHILRAAVQGLGRPDLKAKLDLANAALFLLLLLVLTPRLALVGAASARLVSTVGELAVLFILISHAAPRAFRPLSALGALWRSLATTALFLLAVTTAVVLWRDSPLAYASFGVLTIVHVFVFWKWIADATDRRAISHLWTWGGFGRHEVAVARAGSGKQL